MARDFASMKAAAAALTDFEKARRKQVTSAVRVTAKAVAADARRRAKGLTVVKKATRHNKNIKVEVKFGARYSSSQRMVVGFVRSTGLVAKIEMGLKARKFRLARFKSHAYSFKGSKGWVTVGDVRAGGQTFKKHVIVQMTEAQRSAMTAAIDASMERAVKETL